ncbi:MAG TPA: hypothetical protein VF064_03135 [Pyrinomonadaceae bacterium]
MKIVDRFAGQNWLITPAALAVNEPRPQNIQGQKWLMVLSGVVFAEVKGNSTSQWFRETLHLSPDILSPMNFAVSRHSIPTPPGGGTKAFQVEQWSPFAAPSSMFNQNQSIDSGFAVDVWRPAPFGTGTNELTSQPLNNLFNGIQVDVAVRDTDAILHRVSYNITLLGKIVFLRNIIL